MNNPAHPFLCCLPVKEATAPRKPSPRSYWLDKATVRAIYYDVLDGLTGSQIAKRRGLKTNTVYAIMRKERHKDLTDEIDREMVELQQQQHMADHAQQEEGNGF